MGLIALIFSVVVDAIWPLRGRPQDLPPDLRAGEEAGDENAFDPEAADPLAEPPYDPLIDPVDDAALDVDDAALGFAADPAPGAAAGTAAGTAAGPATAATTAGGATDPMASRPAGSAESIGAAAGAPQHPHFTAHPLLRHALRLIDWVAADDGLSSSPVATPSSSAAAATRAVAGPPRQVQAPGWLVVVGVPVLLVVIAEALLGAVAGFFVFVLHVAVLYLTVGLGAFHRQFSELQLLVGAGEEASARAVLIRWIGAGGAAVGRLTRTAAVGGGRIETSSGLPSQTLASAAAGHSVLAAYRDVFAPLFWYAVLPGAVGPVLYLFARFAACHSQPFARRAYYWLDWIPLRLAALVLALVGRFEDTMYALRALSGVRVAAADDPYLHQRLLLLPVAGGALGLRLSDAAVDDHLRTQAPDLDLPGKEPQAASLRSVAGLLLRASVVVIGAYLLVALLD